MENECNYSDEWQPYIGDYDKHEYDIRLHDGTVVCNCYPNARKFNPMRGEDRQYLEEEVAEIRFSEFRVTWLNLEVSQREYLEPDVIEPPEPAFIDGGLSPLNQIITDGTYVDHYYNRGDYIPDFEWTYPKQRPIVRQGPKLGRNDPCPCGSGKKVKKCLHEN